MFIVLFEKSKLLLLSEVSPTRSNAHKLMLNRFVSKDCAKDLETRFVDNLLPGLNWLRCSLSFLHCLSRLRYKCKYVKGQGVKKRKEKEKKMHGIDFMP